MSSLTQISGMTEATAQLLAAAGVKGAGQLAMETAGHLHKRLSLVAWQKGMGERVVPSLEELAAMIAEAAEAGEAAPVELELDDLPEAIAEEDAGERDRDPGRWVPPTLRAEQQAAGRTASGAVPESREAPPQTWRNVDPSRFATIEDYNAGRIPVKPLSRDGLDAVAEGESDSGGPERFRVEGAKGELSRWVRRGVVHPRGFHTWLGAFVSVVFRLALLAALAAILWLITRAEQPTDYKMPVAAGAGVLLVLGMMQLHFAMRARCRICSCPLYYSKNCLKNRKAHLIPGFGYVMSASLHLLVFGWFRCMYCGTAVRLRPGHR